MKLLRLVTGVKFLALLLFVSIQASAKEQITILAENDWAPYARADGSGIANSLIRTAYREMDVEVEYTVVSFIRLLKLLKLGKALAGFNLAKTPDIADDYNFGQVSLFDTPQVFFVLKGSPLLKYSDRTQLPAKTRVGTIRGYMYGDFIDNNINHLSIFSVSHHKQNVKKLLAGRLDTFIISADVAKNLTTANQFSDQLVAIFPGENIPTYAAFSKIYPNSNHYMDLLDKGLLKIKKNGKHAQIMEQCAGVHSSNIKICQ